MFDTYYPKKFCREFVTAKGNSMQLSLIMATVEGIKPAMDDWVDASRYQLVKKACDKYGLFIAPDTIFEIARNKDIPANSIGKQNLTTTKAFGKPYTKDTTKGTVHFFISRSRGALQKALEYGWYPLIIKNRVIDRPLADTFKFGFYLGYPGCCVRFFQKYNDWFKYNYIYETFKNTIGKKYSYLSNPLNKDVTYSYIYHMPCSFNCSSTNKLAASIRQLIQKKEPEFAELIDNRLKQPCLVFYERKIYIFEGFLKKNRIYYSNFEFIGRDSDFNTYETTIGKGNCLYLNGKNVVILRNGKFVARINPKTNGFAPESPFLITFS